MRHLHTPHTGSEVLLAFANAGQAVKSKQRKKLPQSRLDPAPAARIPWLLSYESHSVATISQLHLAKPKHRIDGKKTPLTILLGRTTSSIPLGKFAICPQILPFGQPSKFLRPLSLAGRPRRPAPPAFCKKNPFFWPVGLQIRKPPPRLARDG